MSYYKCAGALCLSTALVACGPSSSDSDSETTFNVELRTLELGVDTDQPIAVNHRIPVTFTMVGQSSDPSSSENIPVSFSFLEKDPVDPEDPRVCRSNAIDVELPGNGEAFVVEGEFIWPVSECIDLADEGKEVSLQVEFYRGENPLEGTITATLPDLQLRNAGIDIEYNLAAESSVALVAALEGTESALPILTVSSDFVLNGADPYYSVVDADEIPDDLREDEPDIDEALNYGFDAETVAGFTQLPSSASLTYSLIPTNAVGSVLPLKIGEEDGTTSASFEFSSIELGVKDFIAHDLYLEGDSLDAVTEGQFANETDFIVRGCVVSTFAQDGNGAAEDNDCKDVEVIMVRESADSSAATEITFNKTLTRKPGNKRIRIISEMRTENVLNRDGAFSNNVGTVSLSGKIGKRFNLTIAHAEARAGLSDSRAFYDANVQAFNQTIFSIVDSDETSVSNKNKLFSADKEIKVARVGYGFGPVRFGFDLFAGGRVGLDGEDEIALVANGDECQTLLATEEVLPLCGRMSRTISPRFSLTGKVLGGFKSRVVRVGVKAKLEFVETSFPLTNTLGFGLTDNNNFLVNGNANWDTTLRLIKGRVKLVGKIKISRFRRSKSVMVFKFKSKLKTFNLMNRDSGGTVLLQ